MDNDQDAVIRCSECNEYWQTDDGYHWYHEGSYDGVQLETFTRVAVETAEDVKQGSLCYLEDGTGFCPICGKGKLEGQHY